MKVHELREFVINNAVHELIEFINVHELSS